MQPDTALVVARAIASVKVSAAGQVEGTKSYRKRKISLVWVLIFIAMIRMVEVG